MDYRQAVLELVERYRRSIGTQNEREFISLWSGDADDTLISITRRFTGAENICRDFLIGRIQAAYASIELVVESVDVSFPTEDTAVVIFAYHTECTRRADGSPHGIQGLETQLMVRRAGEWKLRHVHYSK